MRAKSSKLPAIKASQWPADQVERRKVERLVTPRTAPDWGKKARELTGQGVDLVVEVGTLNESIRAIRIGGTIAFIGVLAGPSPAELRLPLMVMQQQRLQGWPAPRRQDPLRLGRHPRGCKPPLGRGPTLISLHVQRKSSRKAETRLCRRDDSRIRAKHGRPSPDSLNL